LDGLCSQVDILEQNGMLRCMMRIVERTDTFVEVSEAMEKWKS
jgi:hypothetical protein